MGSYADELFTDKHPVPTRTIFLMMSLADRPDRTALREAIQQVADELAFEVVRADDCDYTGELWANVRVCMDNCALGIAIFDGQQSKSAQVNIALELGYMFALRRKCLILRESHAEPPEAMLAHRLHTFYEAFDVPGTVTEPVRRWLAARV